MKTYYLEIPCENRNINRNLVNDAIKTTDFTYRLENEIDDIVKELPVVNKSMRVDDSGETVCLDVALSVPDDVSASDLQKALDQSDSLVNRIESYADLTIIGEPMIDRTTRGDGCHVVTVELSKHPEESVGPIIQNFKRFVDNPDHYPGELESVPDGYTHSLDSIQGYRSHDETIEVDVSVWAPSPERARELVSYNASVFADTLKQSPEITMQHEDKSSTLEQSQSGSGITR